MHKTISQSKCATIAWIPARSPLPIEQCWEVKEFLDKYEGFVFRVKGYDRISPFRDELKLLP